MTEHLFKLKKDGKCVGYMRLKESPRGLEWRYFDKDDSRESLIRHSIFDTAYPFVCKDENGNDVFAGDTVKAGKWYFEVIWQKYGYGLKGKKSGWWRQFHEFEGVELIKEKGNDTNKT